MRQRKAAARAVASSATLWTAAAAAAILSIVGTEPALAQQGAAPKAATPAAQPPAQPQEQEAGLVYSPWTKFCMTAEPPNNKRVCFTVKDARLESGVPVLAAMLIEPDGDPKKVLRITLPLGMQLSPGTRLIIDRGRPATRPYLICFTNGCTAEYDATADVINRLRRGEQLSVQAVSADGQALNITLPLDDFAKVHAGPPIDPKVFEEQQQKLHDEWLRRANEARQRIESLQPQRSGDAK